MKSQHVNWRWRVGDHVGGALVSDTAQASGPGPETMLAGASTAQQKRRSRCGGERWGSRLQTGGRRLATPRTAQGAAERTPKEKAGALNEGEPAAAVNPAGTGARGESIARGAGSSRLN